MLNFTDFYENYALDVYRFVFWLARDEEEAEDITSETFVRAWVNHNNIRTETLKAYLFTIARNLFLEQRRKNKRQVMLEDSLPDTSPGPVKQVESLQKLQRIKQFLSVMKEPDKTAFILRVQHKLPYAEIARVLGISLASAKVKVHRVRKKLLTEFHETEV
jgi:RNA polymerase sigma-70 factor (ECF subfamily)